MRKVYTTLEEYLELANQVNYYQASGEFTWLNGRVAGTVDTRGYIRIVYQRKSFYAHRLAFVKVLGILPNIVDHTDQNKSNNCFANLRNVTASENLQNVGLSTRNTSGFKGVSFYSRVGLWTGTFRLNGKRIFCGYHSTAEAAAKAITEKKLSLASEGLVL